MAKIRLQIPESEIIVFCRKHHIRRLSVFGSAIHEGFGPESDLDVLVEFQESHVPGLTFFGMENELSMIFGREVDLNTPMFLSPMFRKEVVSEAQVIYAQP